MLLNEQEAATVLFALRYLQSNLEDLRADLEPGETLGIHFIDSDGNSIPDPTEAFIDDICEKVNAPYAKFNVVFRHGDDSPKMREFIESRILDLVPFTDTWSGNDKWDINANIADGVVSFDVYLVDDGVTNTCVVWSCGVIERH